MFLVLLDQLKLIPRKQIINLVLQNLITLPLIVFYQVNAVHLSHKRDPGRTN